MKQLFFCLIVVLLVSCKKAAIDKPEVIHEEVENVTLKVNESFSRVFCCNGVKIKVQATHFQSSEIGLSLGGTTYYYMPSLNYIGTDEVVLEFSSTNNGYLGGPTIVSVDGRRRFKFTITN